MVTRSILHQRLQLRILWLPSSLVPPERAREYFDLDRPDTGPLLVEQVIGSIVYWNRRRNPLGFDGPPGAFAAEYARVTALVRPERGGLARRQRVEAAAERYGVPLVLADELVPTARAWIRDERRHLARTPSPIED